MDKASQSHVVFCGEGPIPYSPTTVGSRSTMTALGTCFPLPVSLKKVVNESSSLILLAWVPKVPSAWMPCSRQKSSQQALPIWTPAWPTWTDMHSLCGESAEYGQRALGPSHVFVLYPPHLRTCLSWHSTHRMSISPTQNQGLRSRCLSAIALGPRISSEEQFCGLL